MAPYYREDNYLIIQPGSERTLVSFGLHEYLKPPAFSVPTKVYVDKDDSTKFTSKSDDESLAIYPIKKGKVTNPDALNYLIKVIFNGVLRQNPTILRNNIALTIIQTSSRWSSLAIEKITSYAFEILQINAFTIVPSALCSMFAFGSFQNSCVIDIGYEKFEVTPILDFQIVQASTVIIDKGGLTVNNNLKKLLPKLNDEQINSLKESNIYEVLSNEDAAKSYFGVKGINDSSANGEGEDEGVLDIAAIVTSEKSTREILAEKEKEKKSKNKKDKDVKPKLNSELENNFFYDYSGNKIEVGKERFQGCTDLIDSITYSIYNSLSKIIDSKKRQDCYDNLIIVGNTTKIPGFKEAILVSLNENYHIGLEQTNEIDVPAFRNESSFNTGSEGPNLSQVPQHIKSIRFPEYFSEWKKVGSEDASFLGGQILAKQVFGHGNTGDLYINREDYLEKGPLEIWHIKM
ncbi:hypothetical protein B5S28_g499 [[Candida] boidinii]|nr:hypothetical protein B5S28_g499 [[Candida] boidinii]